MTEEIEKIIIDILQTEMGLADTYTNGIPVIAIGSQNFNLGHVKDIQIIVSSVDMQILSNKNSGDVSNIDLTSDPKVYGVETQTILARENIQIDLFSKDNTARQRRFEILMALQSMYAREQQEKYQIKIFPKPISMINSTVAEGGSQLNRFTVVVACNTWYEKTKNISEYYDTFEIQVDNENTIQGADHMVDLTIDKDTDIE